MLDELCQPTCGKNFLTLLQHWSGAVMCPALQILGRRMPVYVKRFRNRIGRLALCSQPSDLMT
jgi:hypothetical protein